MTLRKVPHYDRVPYSDDLAEVKGRARAAWIEAKAKAPNLVPPAIADRLWTNGLVAIQAAPPRVQAIMLHRLETTFKLLADQGRWASLETPPASPPRRRAPRARWDG